jgi:hypothetical protein
VAAEKVSDLDGHEDCKQCVDTAQNHARLDVPERPALRGSVELCAAPFVLCDSSDDHQAQQAGYRPGPDENHDDVLERFGDVEGKRVVDEVAERSISRGEQGSKNHNDWNREEGTTHPGRPRPIAAHGREPSPSDVVEDQKESRQPRMEGGDQRAADVVGYRS